MRNTQMSLSQLIDLSLQPIKDRIALYLSEQRVNRYYRHLAHLDRDSKEIERSKSYCGTQIINEVSRQQDLRRGLR